MTGANCVLVVDDDDTSARSGPESVVTVSSSTLEMRTPAFSGACRDPDSETGLLNGKCGATTRGVEVALYIENCGNSCRVVYDAVRFGVEIPEGAELIGQAYTSPIW